MEVQKLRSIACAFDDKFFRFGFNLIRSFLQIHPDYEVHCWAVNCGHLNQFDDIPNVHVYSQTRKFRSEKHKRCFMASYRFKVWWKLLNQGLIDECIAVDSDALVMRNLDVAYEALKNKEILVALNLKLPTRQRLAAGCVVFRNTKGVRRYFSSYVENYKRLRLRQGWVWHNDQRALYNAFEKMKKSLKWGILPPELQLMGGSIYQARGRRKYRSSYESRLKQCSL